MWACQARTAVRTRNILTPVEKNKESPSVYFNWKRRKKLSV